MLKLWSKLVFWILPSGSVARLFANSRLLKNEDESKQDGAKIFESSNIIIGEFKLLPSAKLIAIRTPLERLRSSPVYIVHNEFKSTVLSEGNQSNSEGH